MTDLQLVHTIGRVGDDGRTRRREPDGRRVAFLSGREARVVDVRERRVAYRLEHPGEITSLAFSPTDEGSSPVGVTAWPDLERVQRQAHPRAGRPPGPRARRRDRAGGAEVATASTDGTARIWDGVTGHLRAPLFGHTNFVRTVDFSPDGQSVVTASVDGTARTWALNGRRLATLAGHTGAVVDARFSPDGFTVITGGEDGTVRIWEAGTRPTLPEESSSLRRAPCRLRPAPTVLTATVDDEIVRLERSDGRRRSSRAIGSRSVESGSLRTASVGHRRSRPRCDPVGRRLREPVARAARPLRIGVRCSVQPGRSVDRHGRAAIGRAVEGGRRRAHAPSRRPRGPVHRRRVPGDSRNDRRGRRRRGSCSSYACRICGEIPELLELADERLAATGRELTPEERALYSG